MSEQTRPTPARIRRYYEHRMTPFSPTSRVKRDVLALLEDRKVVQRAADALMLAALPYSADPKVKAAIDDLRAALGGQRKS